ncbi:MAG: hypothetical protein KatS3mg077_0337 [Candidatus Binatia bacterium]|nr:MAG: hypothetical protein KatS3mg077_0337 [Candidatus Binatia bacterium]
MGAAFSKLSGLDRAQSLCDPGTVDVVWHLANSPLLLVRGQISTRPVALALLDGHVRGGTVGLEEAAALSDFLRAFLRQSSVSGEASSLILVLDTGGVRVEEGPRALAAASAAGVLLAECTLKGVPTVSVITGPRGCFGALSVMAALPDTILMVENSHWGLTGPKLFSAVQAGVTEHQGRAATSASERLRSGLVDRLVPDDVEAVRSGLRHSLAALDRVARPSPIEHVRRAAGWLEERRQLWLSSSGSVARHARRRRKLLEYSFRRQWRPTEPIVDAGLLQSAWGELSGEPACGIILGPAEDSYDGIGIIEIAAIVHQLQRTFFLPEGSKATIVNFVFCQGHVVDLEQERLGLPRVLAECLRTYVAVRCSGHRVLSVLGGGTYGAAYLALAAPSHRIFAIRGTKVAPMAPAVLRAFHASKGKVSADKLEQEPAEWIPEVVPVESVVRLPRVLRAAIHATPEPGQRGTVTHAA